MYKQTILLSIGGVAFLGILLLLNPTSASTRSSLASARQLAATPTTITVAPTSTQEVKGDQTVRSEVAISVTPFPSLAPKNVSPTLSSTHIVSITPTPTATNSNTDIDTSLKSLDAVMNGINDDYDPFADLADLMK